MPEDGLPGSLSLTYRRCGKPTCHCAEGRGHPRWQPTHVDGGKKRVETIPAEWVEEVRRRVERAQRPFETPPSVSSRVSTVPYSSFNATSAPTRQQREQHGIAESDFREIQPVVEALIRELAALEDRIRGMGGPLLPRGGM